MADATPSTGAAAVLAQASALWSKQPRGKKTIAIAAVVLVLGGVGYATLVHHGETWVGFAESASPDDASEIYATLQGRDIPVRLRDGKVEVPADRASEARALAASRGLPHASKGLGLFDEQNLGASGFDEQVKFRRGIQGELDNTIASMAQVETAKVLVSFGKTSVFKDQEVPPSASVSLHLHAGQILTSDQVRGVRQLVAASVEGMKPEAVVIVDGHGNLLEASDASASDHKAELERTVTVRVRTMLERVVGVGKASVVATADVDDRKTSETEEVYDKDRAVIRSESRTVEGANATASAGIGGVAGTQGNLPGAPAAAATAGGSGAGKVAETKNFEVSRTVRQTQGATGQVKKLHLAVVVDYKLENGKPVPRTDKEIAELTALARQAAGIDDARGDSLELRAIAFAPEAEVAAAPPVAPDWTEQLPLPLPILAAAAGGGLLLLILAVVVVLAIKRARKRARIAAAEATPIALPAPLADLERVLEARSAPQAALAAPIEAPALPAGPPVQERVLAAVRSDVERAAAVLTSWLAEPPPKGAKP